MVVIFTGDTVGSLQVPEYVSLATWSATPLLLNTPHQDLLDAIESYDPAAEFILLTAGVKVGQVGQYAWWRVPLLGKPGVGLSATQHPTKN